MAVHRYKYAIGNAPIRFPAADAKVNDKIDDVNTMGRHRTKDAQTMGKAGARRPSKGNSGKNRWTMFAGDGQMTQGASASSAKTMGPPPLPANDLKVSASTSDLRKPAPVRGAPAGRHSNVSPGFSDVPVRTASPFSLTPAWSRGRKGSTSSERSDPGVFATPDISERTRALLTTTPVPTGSGVSTPSRSQTASPASAASTMRASSPRFPSPFRAWRSTTQPMDNDSIHSAEARSPLLRPHSHFWTDMNASPRSPLLGASSSSPQPASGKKLFYASERDRTLSNISSSTIKQYGAVDDRSMTKGAKTPTVPGSTRHSQLLLHSSASAAYDADDPYGYRALAGPTLLPAFHEQRLQQQQREEYERSTWRRCFNSRRVTLLLLLVLFALALTNFAAFPFMPFFW